MQWIETATLFAVLLSALLTTMLLSHRQLGTAGKWLAALSGALTLVLFDSFSYQQNLHTEYPHILGLIFPLHLLFAPLLYGYISHLLCKEVKRVFLWHLAPFALSVLLMMPFYLQSSADKAALMAGSATEQAPWYLTPGIVFIVAGSFIQTPVYLWLCLKQTLRTINALKSFYSSPFVSTIIWIIALQLAFVLFWVLDITYLMLDSFGVSGFPINQITDLMLLVILVVMTVLGFQKQTLFEPLIAHPEIGQAQRGYNPHQKAIELAPPQSAPEDRKVKYEKSSLTASLAENLFRELSQHMESHQSYLDSELSLNQLAEETGHSLHNISQAINQSQQLNFFDFVNQYRVETVKSRLVAEPDMTIIDIGLQSGFNSKSAFYAAFRKSTGMTPSKFRQLSKAEAVEA